MNKYLFTYIIVLLFSCSNGVNMEASIANMEMSEAMPQGLDSGVDPVEQSKTKLIKDGRISLEADNIAEAKSAIDAMVKNHGGYYESENYNSNYVKTYELKVRIPSQKFDHFVTDVESTNEYISHKELKVRDVNRQFVDLEIRLESKKNYLVRYRELLKKANTIAEILSIEGQIRNIEEEIESTTGQLKYLSDQVDFSTLSITIRQNDKYSEPQGGLFFKRLKNSLVSGWNGLVYFTFFIIRYWPFWLVLGFFFYLWRRKLKKKKES